MNPRDDELIRSVYTSDIGFIGSPLSKVIVGFMCIGHAIGAVWYFDYLTVLKAITVFGVLASGVAFLYTEQVKVNSKRLKSLFSIFVIMVVLFQMVQRT